MYPHHDWYDEQRPKLSQRLYETLRIHPGEEKLPVIIVMREGVPARDDELLRRVQGLGGIFRRDLPIIRGISAALSPKDIREIGPHAKVKRVHLDRYCRPCLDVGRPTVYGDAVQARGFSGRGATIAVVDSGLHPHPDFLRPSPRILAWHDVVNDRPDPYDDHGHGTHVAGIAAGNGHSSGGRYRGIAPQAGLVGVKVANAEGSAPMSAVIVGLQWILDNQERYGIRVINLSLGSDPSESYQEDPLCQAVEGVWRAGLVVVAAAGNDGPKPGSIDTPGNDPLIITVGAMDDRQTVARRDDRLADFSSRGPTNDGLLKPDLLAPGVNITAPQIGGGYVSRTGTSMATPFVSGAAALVLGADPDLSPGQVKEHLLRSAENQGLPRLKEGAGYLNLERLLATAGPAKSPSGSEARTTVMSGIRQMVKRNLINLGLVSLRSNLMLLLLGLIL